MALYHCVQREQLIGDHPSTIESALMYLYSTGWNGAAVNLGLSKILSLGDDLIPQVYTNMGDRCKALHKNLTQSQMKNYAKDIVFFTPLYKHIAESTLINAEQYVIIAK